MAKINEYRFSLGDSSKGPVGFCISVKAATKKDAVALLKESLPAEIKIRPDNEEQVFHGVVFINANAITEADIEDEEEVDGE